MSNIESIANEIKIESTTRSIYGNVKDVNVRVSDHLPKTYNIANYKGRLVSKDGVFKFVFVLTKDIHSDFNRFSDTDEIEEKLIEDLALDLDLDEDDLKVAIYIIDEKEEFSKDYFDMLINTL